MNLQTRPPSAKQRRLSRPSLRPKSFSEDISAFYIWLVRTIQLAASLWVSFPSLQKKRDDKRKKKSRRKKDLSAFMRRGQSSNILRACFLEMTLSASCSSLSSGRPFKHVLEADVILTFMDHWLYLTLALPSTYVSCSSTLRWVMTLYFLT